MSEELVGVVYTGSFQTAVVGLPSGASVEFERDGDPVDLSKADADHVLSTNEDFKPADKPAPSRRGRGADTTTVTPTGEED